ncbi:MAG TPA: hypothetical protein VMH85_11705 [Terriglobales bacterium]|nr:hypothetical protein [Terriglobales bacterium]
MSVTAVASISALGNQGDGSSQSASSALAFQKTSQSLQSQQLDSAKRAANAVDTVKLSGQAQNEKLTTDVTMLSRNLQTGDLGAAQTAYRAIQEDLQQHQEQAGNAPSSGPEGDTSHAAVTRNVDPTNLAVGSARIRASSEAARKNIDLSA